MMQLDQDGRPLFRLTLDSEAGTAELSPADQTATESTTRWTAGGDKDRYSCIYSYSGGTLTYEDCSSGEWKTVKISE